MIRRRFVLVWWDEKGWVGLRGEAGGMRISPFAIGLHWMGRTGLLSGPGFRRLR